jgi:hypothetical protein
MRGLYERLYHISSAKKIAFFALKIKKNIKSNIFA